MGHLNIKALSYQYWDSYHEDETVSQRFSLYDGNPYTWGPFY